MIVKLKMWELSRHLFTDEDKDELNDAITGETICPPGVVVDLAKLDERLRNKVKENLSEPIIRAERPFN